MARQLPALVPDQRSLSRIEESNSAVSKLLAAIAPDLVRAAERLATQRIQRRDTRRSAGIVPDRSEAVHLSEVEIDVSVPFVRRITMRNMTAWQTGPAPEPEKTEQSTSGMGIGRKIGVLGASSVLALCLGVLARRIAPFGDDDRVIDVVGKPKP